MPREKLLPRAWELARQLAKKSDMLLRYTRKVLTHPLRRAIDDGMQFNLAMEALSTLDRGSSNDAEAPDRLSRSACQGRQAP